MWIVPKNYPLSSAFALDMVESKEDLSLQGLDIESSLMWRSKASPLRTWQTRWNRVSWMPHLFTRILKPSQHISFEAALTSSLADIRASRSAQREGAGVKMTPAISGHTSDGTLTQLNLFNASSRTSRDTSRLDSPLSSATWKKMVTTQRGEYSQRLKSEPLTNASESLSLPTPSATPYGSNQGGAAGRTGKVRHSLESMARHNLWPTPTVQDSNKATKKLRDNHQNNLTAIVFNQQLPTPTSRDWKGGYAEKSLTRKDGKSRRFDALPNAAIGGVGTDIVAGHLNPAWIEWLMGVPTGWTELGCWETE